MAAYQGSTNRTSRAAPTVQQQQQQQSQQFAMPRLEDKLIIYGDGLVFGGGPHADPFRSMPQAQTAAPFAQQLPTQGNNSFTGLSNSSMNNLVPPQRMQQPWQQQQQQQQQHLQQQRQQPYSPTNGARISRNGLNQLPQQQQQQRPLQQQPLQHSMQQQQPQQLVQQQQLQQAYNHWPFGGIAQTNNPNGFGYNQNHAWPGYTVMNPINPNWTYTFG
ncbi:hypothetical protein KR215_007196 [Drosophila sulfurigaster]|nr:hypothetical protein KR215_007196 [Drosophila sulfurigaster]